MAAAVPSSKARRIVLLQTVVSLLLLIWLAFRVEWADMAKVAADLDWRWLAGVIAFLLMTNAIAAWRWSHAARLARASLAFADALPIHYGGMYLNLFFPGTVAGDAWRIWKATELIGDMGGAARGVFAERLLFLAGLLLLVVGTLPWLPHAVTAKGLTISAVAVVAFLIVTGVVAVVFLPRLVELLPERLRASAAAKAAADLKRVLPHLTRPLPATIALVASLAGHLSVIAVLYCAVRATGAALSPADALVLLPPVLLLATLPLSIAGWGVRESGMVAVLGLAAVPAEQALLGSVVVGLGMMVAHAPAALMVARGPRR